MDGKFDVIPYDDIVILCKSDRKKLIPNIYINTKFLSVGETIRGTIIIVSKTNDIFSSLSKKQCIKYINFLKNVSFNYNNNSNIKRTFNDTSKQLY